MFGALDMEKMVKLDSLMKLDSSDMLMHLFAHVDVAMMIVSLDRNIIMMNDFASRLTGYSKDEIVGKSTKILYAREKDFLDLGTERYNPNAEYQADHYVVPYMTKQGNLFWGDAQGGLIKDSSGEPLCYMSIVYDVTEQYRATQTLNLLHSITSNRDLDFTDRMNQILELGCEHFDQKIAILSEIKGDHYTVRYVCQPEDALEQGQVFSLENTYCAHVFKANDVQDFHHAGKSSISNHPCYLNFGLESYIGSPIFVDGKRYGTLNFSSPDPRLPFTEQDKEIIRLLAQWIGHELARIEDLNIIEKASIELEKAANSDPLTLLPNRRNTDIHLEKQLARFHRLNEPMTVAIIDFDYFKVLNDTYGHHAGDEALKQFSKMAKESLRKYDHIGRWGGEEFLVILPNTHLDTAFSILDRLRSNVEHSSIQYLDQDIEFTISIGVSESIAEDTVDSICIRADDALYDAKTSGRNQVYINNKAKNPA